MKVKDNQFLELIHLAKTNSPKFLVLFKEMYPYFLHKLLSLNPDIRNSELTLCAMAYLNFSTKKLPNILLLPLPLFEVEKIECAKKYNIPSEMDFNKWFQELEN